MTNDAWNPGLTSEIPARLMPLVTLYRPENGSVSYKNAAEAAAFTGLKPKDMAAFTLERLILHELLIRVTADLSVPDGPNYEELGLNLRGMAHRIYDGYVEPDLDTFSTLFQTIREDGRKLIDGIIEESATAPPPRVEPAPGFWAKLTGKQIEIPADPPENLGFDAWQAQLQTTQDPARKAALSALVKIAESIIRTRGRLMADADMIVGLALNMYMNTYGSAALGRRLDPIIRNAAKAEGYRILPAQDKPLFMNVKGASASGKSTIRPQQRALAEKLDVPWEDFALISPDYWRKSLLEYESLGEDYKYGAMLTGQELEIIDKKLDLHVAEKAANKAVPHLLIDRFRFDSFTTDSDGKISSRLLTRFCDTVFLFFLVTPPAATVERAWSRGLDTGRYKAVDDLLFHNIEAYTGMPELFFSWMGSSEKKIHFEFLDNSVAYGELPRTIAYGWNGKMTVLDVDGLHNIDRFRAVNVDATRPEDVLTEAPELTFLERCVRQIDTVTVVDPETREISARSSDGTWLTDIGDDAKLSDAAYEMDRSLNLGAWGRTGS